ncbi:hypothetical protein BKA80DRAFT_272104 [Phyllosticta citrichinensis]
MVCGPKQSFKAWYLKRRGLNVLALYSAFAHTGACTTSVRPVGLRGWRHAMRAEASCILGSKQRNSISRGRILGKRFRRACAPTWPFAEKAKRSHLDGGCCLTAVDGWLYGPCFLTAMANDVGKHPSEKGPARPSENGRLQLAYLFSDWTTSNILGPRRSEAELDQR